MRQGRAAQRNVGTPPNALFALTAILIAAAAVLGGASRENPIRLATVELCALPLAVLAIRRLAAAPGSLRRIAAPLAILALIVAAPLAQLIPLPPALWTRAPGQEPRVEALRLAGLATPWLPLSLFPQATGEAALALIPPAAIFLGALRLGPGEARRLVWLWLGLAALGLVLGVAQMASPAGGWAYPYATTNLGSLVGLFANRNHEAGFLLALLPFAAVLALPPPSRRDQRPGETGARGGGGGAGLAGLFVLISLVALGVIRSRAGVLLAAPAAIGAGAVLWRGAPGRLGWRPLAGVAAAAAIAVTAVGIFGLAPILDRFGGQGGGEFRFEAWPHVARAAWSFLPLGSGLGSFDRVFRSVEPLTLVAPAYFNHAHNDYLELWLETGLVGAAILFLFAAWLAAAVWRAWRSGTDLARAASVAALLLLAESVVDYPLRTETLAVQFAFCCALLAREGARLR